MSGAADTAVAYPGMVEAAVRMVEATIPDDGVVAVVSKGDDALLALGSRRAVHFPAGPDGRYAGYYPKDGVAAVEWIEQARRDGVDHLLLPATALWWLDHYEELRDHLHRVAREVGREEGAGVVFSFRPAGAVVRPPGTSGEGGRAAQMAGMLDALLPEDASVVYIGAARLRSALGRRPALMFAAPEETAGYERLTERLRRTKARFLVVDVGDDDDSRRLDVVAELGRRFRRVAGQAAVCVVFDVCHDPEVAADGLDGVGDLTDELIRRAAALLPPGAQVTFWAGDSDDEESREPVIGQFLVVAAALDPAPPPGMTLMWSDGMCRIYATGGGA